MSKPIVAVDLGNYAVKVLQVRQENKKIKIERASEIANRVGANLPTDDLTADKLVQLMNDIFTDQKLAKTDVRLSLPESLVSTKVITIPPLSDAELASAISWQAEQHIPIPLEELSLEYQVLYRPDKKTPDEQMRVLMVGTRKNIIDKYLNVFLKIGIEPTLLETQTISLIRSLQIGVDEPPTLIVDMGAMNTNLSILYKGELRFVYTFPSGSQVLTRTIEQAIQLDPKQAEEYKRSYGLDSSQLAGKIRDILLPAVRSVTAEMKKATQFFMSQSTDEPIRRVLLAGGGAQLPGLPQFIAEDMGVEVLVASPFANTEGALPTVNQPAYGICMGLVMKEGN